MNIAIAAEEAAGVQALRAAADAGHRVVAVLTSAEPERRRAAAVAVVAAGLGIPVLPARLVRSPECADVLRQRAVDLLLNVHSLYIVDADVLRAPRIGSFNLHPGPLPQYAGLNAPSWAVFRGETSHAVTVHWMRAGIDTGAIAYQAAFGLGEHDTGLSVSATCVRLGIPLLRRLLEDATDDPARIPALEQCLARRRYHGKEVPYGGKIRWSSSAAELSRFVRACDFHPLPSPWGEPRAELDGKPIGILGATCTGIPCAGSAGLVDRLADGTPVVATGDEWIRIHNVRIGGRRVDARAVLTPGQRLADGS